MTDAEIIDAVTAKLTDLNGTFDNMKTQTRQFWEHGRLRHYRPRDGCDGDFFAVWGTYPDLPHEH